MCVIAMIVHSLQLFYFRPTFSFWRRESFIKKVVEKDNKKCYLSSFIDLELLELQMQTFHTFSAYLKGRKFNQNMADGDTRE